MAVQLNQKIRTLVMRAYFQRVISKNYSILCEEVTKFNKDARDFVKAHVTDVVLASSNFDIITEDSSSLKLRAKGKKAEVLELFPQFMETALVDSKIYIDGDLLPDGKPYRGLSNPEYYYSEVFVDGVKEVKSDDYRLLGSFSSIHAGKTSRSGNFFKLPKVASYPAVPAAEFNKLIKRQKELVEWKKKVQESLSDLHTLLNNHKTEKSLREAWPQGAEMINHAIIRSKNSLPIRAIKELSELANMK